MPTIEGRSNRGNASKERGVKQVSQTTALHCYYKYNSWWGLT